MRAFLRLLLPTLFLSLALWLPVQSLNSPPYALSLHEHKAEKVYITKTGSKYHKGDCSYLRQSKITTTKKDAQGNGYTACSRCRP